MKFNRLQKIQILFWMIGLFGFTMIILTACITPPIDRDGLIHHLAIPKLWIQHGGFYETPWADFSYYPMTINLLYLIPLVFKNDILPKMIHMLFGMGTGFLVFLYLKKRFDSRWGLLGFFIFISTPIIIWLSTSAYIDLGMTFFSTASVLALIKWRDGSYENTKWLLISACCMGVAVGSKYNALIAWFITNLLLTVIYVRDTDRQMSAVKYAAIFFLVTAAVASPWYIKNYILRENPFYPLFNSFFMALHSPDQATAIIGRQMERSPGKIGFFQFRAHLYGESFWETLFIPIRMFFQGEDNSYQYFQGRLNPVLIVFLPFILLNRRHGKDKLLFFGFSFFFMFMAYFTTEKQVRYIAPVLPIMTILAVTGINHLSGKFKEKQGVVFKLLHGSVFLTVAILLVPNFFYLKDHFKKIDPVPYILGKETRDDFLKRHLLDYPGVQFINAALPEDAVIYTIYLGRRGYYLEREYRNDPSFGVNVLRRLAAASEDEFEFVRAVKSLGATHIFMRTDLADRFMQVNYKKEEIVRFLNMVKKHWKLLYNHKGYAVWRIG